MKLSLQWIFDHINADWRKQDPEKIIKLFNQMVAEIEGHTTLKDGDVVFEVDNKSITHRPDMWGHRGFAREIAAFLGLELKPISTFLKAQQVRFYSEKSLATPQQPYIIQNNATQSCLLFGGVYIKSIENKASISWMAERLTRVDVKSIDAIVDLTNYVMLDLGQPMHAYDAAKLAGKTITVRMAQAGEKLLFRDGSSLELDPQDTVIADQRGISGLAGITGGGHDAISASTNSIYLESANWAAGVMRRSSVRHHIRTEASARGEKTLDPSQTIQAIQRFLALADQCGVKYQVEGEIACIGKLPEPKSIEITHSFIQTRLGETLPQAEVEKILKRLEFSVQTKPNHDDVTYAITIPTFRATKDIAIKEDIVEEIARSYGFSKIPLQIPPIHKQARDLTPVLRVRKIKQFLAFTAGMVEQQSHVFSDGPFLDELGLGDVQALELTNPVAQTHSKLVTSLIPNLFKNVKENMHEQDQLRYFEWGRIWPVTGAQATEKRTLAGIFFEKKHSVEFYESKFHLQGLFDLLSLPVSWEKIASPIHPWVSVHQTAQLTHGKQVIGYAGKVAPTFLAKLGVVSQADAFVFELDGDFLLSYVIPVPKFEPLPRFQGATFDLSFLLPLSISTAQVEKSFRSADSLIDDVQMIDFFEKEEWDNVRSLAFRVWVSHADKTLVREEIEQIRQKTIQVIQGLGGELRA